VISFSLLRQGEKRRNRTEGEVEQVILNERKYGAVSKISPNFVDRYKYKRGLASHPCKGWEGKTAKR
jgi:hypothetical protein